MGAIRESLSPAKIYRFLNKEGLTGFCGERVVRSGRCETSLRTI